MDLPALAIEKIIYALRDCHGLHHLAGINRDWNRTVKQLWYSDQDIKKLSFNCACWDQKHLFGASEAQEKERAAACTGMTAEIVREDLRRVMFCKPCTYGPTIINLERDPSTFIRETMVANHWHCFSQIPLDTLLKRSYPKSVFSSSDHLPVFFEYYCRAGLHVLALQIYNLLAPKKKLDNDIILTGLVQENAALFAAVELHCRSRILVSLTLQHKLIEVASKRDNLKLFRYISNMSSGNTVNRPTLAKLFTLAVQHDSRRCATWMMENWNVFAWDPHPSKPWIAVMGDEFNSIINEFTKGTFSAYTCDHGINEFSCKFFCWWMGQDTCSAVCANEDLASSLQRMERSFLVYTENITKTKSIPFIDHLRKWIWCFSNQFPFVAAEEKSAAFWTTNSCIFQCIHQLADFSQQHEDADKFTEPWSKEWRETVHLATRILSRHVQLWNEHSPLLLLKIMKTPTIDATALNVYRKVYSNVSAPAVEDPLLQKGVSLKNLFHACCHTQGRWQAEKYRFLTTTFLQEDAVVQHGLHALPSDVTGNVLGQNGEHFIAACMAGNVEIVRAMLVQCALNWRDFNDVSWYLLKYNCQQIKNQTLRIQLIKLLQDHIGVHFNPPPLDKRPRIYYNLD